MRRYKRKMLRRLAVSYAVVGLLERKLRHTKRVMVRQMGKTVEKELDWLKFGEFEGLAAIVDDSTISVTYGDLVPGKHLL